MQQNWFRISKRSSFLNTLKARVKAQAFAIDVTAYTKNAGQHLLSL
jgi:hypothetical protein